MRLEEGKSYAADVTLTAFEALLGGADGIIARLQSAGFAHVNVRGMGRNRFRAFGLWTGASAEVSLPSQVTNVEEVTHESRRESRAPASSVSRHPRS
jgi:hypothetical protein